MRLVPVLFVLCVASAQAQIICKSASGNNDERRSQATLTVCTNPDLRAQNDQLKELRRQVGDLGGMLYSKEVDHFSKYRERLFRCKDLACIQAQQGERSEVLLGLLNSKQGSEASGLVNEARQSSDPLMRAIAEWWASGKPEMAKAYKAMQYEIGRLSAIGGSDKIEQEQNQWSGEMLIECSKRTGACKPKLFEERLQRLQSDVNALHRRYNEEKSYASAEKLVCRFAFGGKNFESGLRLNTDGTAILTELGGNSSMTVRYFGKFTETASNVSVKLARTEVESNDHMTQLKMDGHISGVAVNDGRMDAALNEHKLQLTRTGPGLRGTYVYDHKTKGRREMPVQCVAGAPK